MRKQFLIMILVLGSLASCLKEEIPVPKQEPGDVITSEVNMSSDYKWQIYFNLKENKVVGQNIKTTWDLGFESDPNNHRIILNSSKSMFVYPTNETDFQLVDDTAGYTANKKLDAPNGDMTKTAIGDWSTGMIYIIDRGYDESGIHQGFFKSKFLSADENAFKFVFAQLNSNQLDTILLPVDDAYNFSFFNLSTKQQVMVEPPKEDWDLVFTQYTHIFYEPEETPYLVTGCLLNRYNTKSLLDESLSFDGVDLEIATFLQLNESINEIGYDWKAFSGSTYIVNSDNTYIIEDQNGFLYKWRFIDFYTSTGEKGNPVWEYQKL
ncbi:MAG: hypothetical protein COA32_01370 [Fluviicola sp.]|nr:MAG: hypothetical protein COA32_01370 [Fluviicola sp.]